MKMVLSRICSSHRKQWNGLDRHTDRRTTRWKH